MPVALFSEPPRPWRLLAFPLKLTAMAAVSSMMPGSHSSSIVFLGQRATAA